MPTGKHTNNKVNTICTYVVNGKENKLANNEKCLNIIWIIICNSRDSRTTTTCRYAHVISRLHDSVVIIQITYDKMNKRIKEQCQNTYFPLHLHHDIISICKTVYWNYIKQKSNEKLGNEKTFNTLTL